MASGKNTIVKEVRIGQVVPDMTNFMSATLSTFKQGDLLILDTTSSCIRAATAESEMTGLLGVATIDVTLGVPPAVYSTDVDASVGVPALNGPIFGMTAKMLVVGSVALAPGQSMYATPASGARYVQPLNAAATGTKIIGTYQGPTISSTVAGSEVEVLIGSRYPGDTLKF